LSTSLQPSFKTKKSFTSIALVVVLHALLLWAIASGLGLKVVQVSENTVEALLLAENKPAAPPPPAPKTPPPPRPATPTPPPTPTPAPLPTPSTNTPAISAPAPAAAPAAPAAPANPVRTSAVRQAGGSCAEPSYPSASRRMEEEGTVTLKFLIGIEGKVKEAVVEKSSGFNRLDEAAKNALSKCQFRPGTVDGKPEESWATIRYTWKLE
jgi:protein TonB